MDVASQTIVPQRKVLIRQDAGEMKVYISRPRSAWRPVLFALCGLMLGISAAAIAWDRLKDQPDSNAPGGKAPVMAPAALAPKTALEKVPVESSVRSTPKAAVVERIKAPIAEPRDHVAETQAPGDAEDF
ncbi:MAG: hypothetical protein HY291_18400 [Planctomycetes bacterium]|nr:hypothetical protein [Planctomycetota bacterium]